MKAAQTRQFDLFAAPAPHAGAEQPGRAKAAAPRRAGGLVPRPASPADPEAMVRHLEATGNYRILRRLEPRPVLAGWTPAMKRPGEKLGVILDTETTGLDATVDEIIELGMVTFTYGAEGIGDVVSVFSRLREPARPIGPEITRITGITDEMVAGRTIDPAEVAAFVAPADLVIAHNARFDRPFCERFAPGFADKPWACSVAEVDWSELGFEGAKLTYLVGQCGFFHNGHRAVDDCHALLEVLAFEAEARTTGFSRLVASAERRSCRIFAVGSPFELKDLLKARGYRWNDGSDGRPKSWWIEADESAHADECRFLREEVYRRDYEPLVQWLTATERYKA
ncbi:3'-5' exonuclease [Jiella avicenniae]|uniref:3'-5' exonuclease n=1 Tax=Jiella avicenniae TaxID=2907202 RepID=A0A9X1P684_9HYPH|nr:3'-5' exonuclease [Jiella avicenniae]MCE7030589.1 3'-5' exonuclease [Jiella avicenniae]